MRPISTLQSYSSSGETKTLLTEVGCANSLAFSADGKRMYFADSRLKKIWQYTYDISCGNLRDARLFVELAKQDGLPDSSCVDSEDALWNAGFGGGSVQRYMPDGIPDIRVSVPVPNVTSCCFGGPELDTLYITTARFTMSDAELERHSSAGGIYAVSPGVRGLTDAFFV
jgi:L-arabinonolactonase